MVMWIFYMYKHISKIDGSIILIIFNLNFFKTRGFSFVVGTIFIPLVIEFLEKYFFYGYILG